MKQDVPSTARVRVGTADIWVDSRAERRNRVDSMSLDFDIDDVFHAVDRLMGSIAPQLLIPTLNTKLTQIRHIVKAYDGFCNHAEICLVVANEVIHRSHPQCAEFWKARRTEGVEAP